jgi:hypothetical protein
MVADFVPGQSFETPKFVYCRDPIRAGELIRELNANPSTLISLDLETAKARNAKENTPLSARARARAHAYAQAHEQAKERACWEGKEALYPHLGEIRLLTVSVSGSKTVIFDFRALGAADLPWRSLFENREAIVHNGMFECKWIKAKLGFRLPKVFDTMHAAHLLQNGIDGQLNHLGLAAVLKRYLGRTIDKEEQRSDFGVETLSLAQITYAAGDLNFWLCSEGNCAGFWTLPKVGACSPSLARICATCPSSQNAKGTGSGLMSISGMPWLPTLPIQLLVLSAGFMNSSVPRCCSLPRHRLKRLSKGSWVKRFRILQPIP